MNKIETKTQLEVELRSLTRNEIIKKLLNANFKLKKINTNYHNDYLCFTIVLSNIDLSKQLKIIDDKFKNVLEDMTYAVEHWVYLQEIIYLKSE